MDKNIRHKIWRLTRVILFVLIDVIFAGIAVYGALALRIWADGGAGSMTGYKDALLLAIPCGMMATVVSFFAFGIYNVKWEYAGMRELTVLAAACGTAGILNLIVYKLLDIKLPRSHFLIFIALLGLLAGAERSIIHVRNKRIINSGKLKRTMIIGAGRAGAMVVRELQTSHSAENAAVCFIDDDYKLWGTRIMGVKVVGNDNVIEKAIKDYKIDEVFVAIPSLTNEQRTRIFKKVENAGCPVKVLPSLSQFANDQAALGQLRNMEIEDLLARDTIKIDNKGVNEMFRGRVVMVTGGGGSIGSELCRQLAGLELKQLIIFDIYENNAYEIQQELKKSHPELDVVTLIGSVRDEVRLDGVFDKYRPEFVFHAAAHKHVPLMEDSPNEAIKNNVFGTYNVAKTCMNYGVKRMLLVSTDKAVNPTNVMGASKRMCEMIVQMLSRMGSSTDFVAVRFGNVLGSNGSVIPLFKKQIEAGGPVTVTDPNIIRYFMTIPEAVSLILDAGTYASGGEIFVLDMGKPVRIDDLARRMIRLSGHTPDVDIEVKYTGLRPGEKLYEELLLAEEGMKKTANDLIYIGKPLEFDETEFSSLLEEMRALANDENADIRPMIKRIVPTYVMKESESK